MTLNVLQKIFLLKRISIRLINVYTIFYICKLTNENVNKKISSISNLKGDLKNE